MGVHSYKELVVWQKSIALVKVIYELTKNFPRSEQFGVVSQMRRAAVSIPSNIAEGYGRKSSKEYKQFYSIAYGSALELDTQLIICRELELVSQTEYEKAERLLSEVIKMLYVMVYKK
ncbi:hypothetical protein COV28_01460 [candidate division WWE3 bacterium CG10_big_fil_rev_8_21_14_0_10_48_23]|nr:MAG: hypothetical protein COV28_01460 [candidate division WWE3 bacterium CG10_big_fil_rev_8_21_14_0_10_48_23]